MSALFTPQQIEQMSYTDFVGFVNQWNVPPGAYNTLTSWRIFSEISAQSKILEVACTTGFSGREIALMTGAGVTGIDISEASVKAAIANQQAYAPDAHLRYEVADALTYEPRKMFSHVITGAALRFFPDPDAALKHLINLLAPDGYILSTEFYTVKPIPRTLAQQAFQVFDIQVTQQEYKDVMSVYRDLTLMHEERREIYHETEAELKHYCDSTIERFARVNPDYDERALRTCQRRLMEIKETSNRLRPYQNYNVLIHKADSRYYPHRYTEVF